MGGDGDDRDRPSTRPDGPGTDWRPPYSGTLEAQFLKKPVLHVRAHGTNRFYY